MIGPRRTNMLDLNIPFVVKYMPARSAQSLFGAHASHDRDQCSPIHVDPHEIKTNGILRRIIACPFFQNMKRPILVLLFITLLGFTITAVGCKPTG